MQLSGWKKKNTSSCFLVFLLLFFTVYLRDLGECLCDLLLLQTQKKWGCENHTQIPDYKGTPVTSFQVRYFTVPCLSGLPPPYLFSVFLIISRHIAHLMDVQYFRQGMKLYKKEQKKTKPHRLQKINILPSNGNKIAAQQDLGHKIRISEIYIFQFCL